MKIDIKSILEIRDETAASLKATFAQREAENAAKIDSQIQLYVLPYIEYELKESAKRGESIVHLFWSNTPHCPTPTPNNTDYMDLLDQLDVDHFKFWSRYIQKIQCELEQYPELRVFDIRENLVDCTPRSLTVVMS